MKSMFLLFWQISLLRESPASVPTYGWFVALVLVANIVTSLTLSVLLDDTVTALQIITHIVISLTMVASLTWLALSLRERGNRFVATFTAWIGCDLVMTLLFAAILPVAQAMGAMMLQFLRLFFFVWYAAAYGSIFKHALDIPLPLAVIVATGILLFSVSLSRVVLGV